MPLNHRQGLTGTEFKTGISGKELTETLKAMIHGGSFG